MNFSIKFMSASTKIETTMEKLKPYVENILYDSVVPIMFITEHDVETFQANPVEYIRSQYDF